MAINSTPVSQFTGLGVAAAVLPRQLLEVVAALLQLSRVASLLSGVVSLSVATLFGVACLSACREAGSGTQLGAEAAAYGPG